MICVAPAAPPVSVHQCQLSVLIHATISATFQCPSELPFSVTHQCQSVPPINASQCHLSVCSAPQCRLTVPPISASQCHLSVPYMSAAFQCPSVMPVNAHQCHLPVPPHQCPSVQPISVHHCNFISAHQ
ncbi:unnamed protein product, partial [Staurois parvus]